MTKKATEPTCVSLPNATGVPAQLARELQSYLSKPDSVREHISLKEVSNWRVGGCADMLVTPSTPDEVKWLIGFLAEKQVPWLVIGHTTNLLFPDEGVRAVLIKLANQLSGLRVLQVKQQEWNVEAECGLWVPRFARELARAGLTGAEHIAGIPGTVGGLVCMNGGSMRRSISESLVSVDCITPTGQALTLSPGECNFAYRQSRIKDSGLVILRSKFRFQHGDRHKIRQQMLHILRARRFKFPRKLPNCGSVFISDPSTHEKYGAPGAIIEKCGLKGKRIGGAEISRQHANFITNIGGATSDDVLSLIFLIRETVKARLGFELKCEVRYVLPNGTVQAAHVLC